ncbi:MAG TPA: methyltransferase domain-containing protein [Gammaproteobacteria bacterium]|nr:methyltransferase domain-containing protein [Gammaproteobacteria bacterium]
MEKRLRCIQDPAHLTAAMRDWYATRTGVLLLNDIKCHLDRLLPQIFGYHAVQIGCVAPEIDLMGGSRIKHWVNMDINPFGVDLMAAADALPFDADCVDLIVLWHTLDFATEPHRVLREIERVLIPEGRLIIVGFNPRSVYGLWRLVLGWRGRVPWCGHFFSSSRLKDWLSLLGLVIDTCEYCGFRPPIQRARILRYMAPIEWLGYSAFPIFGGVRLLVACKRVTTLTPLKPSWRRLGRLAPGKLTEPAMRLHTNVPSS